MLLGVSGVSKLFAAEIVLTGVTFRLEHREKVALVGRNGTGKTTLLKILTGEYLPDSGSVHWARGVKIGYLRQMNVIEEVTVLQAAQAGVKEMLAMQQRLTELEDILEGGKATDDDLEEFARLHEHFADAEGFNAQRNVQTVLAQMGFTEDDFGRLTAELSGGQKTRLALAKLLLEEPDLLILDEPTNHLDLQATEWLERWIRQYPGAVLIVSHDRTFLENTVNRVLEIRQASLKSYPGNFVQFVRLRKEEDERQTIDAARQAQEIAKLDEFVRRFMNSQRTAQARGRLKMLDRLLSNRIEAPTNERGIKGALKPTARSGEIVASFEKATIGYPDQSLLKGFDWLIRWRERWGVIGDNGSGKSTLIKSLVGRLPLLAGKAKLGSGVMVGYFSQDASEFDDDMTPLEYMVYECNLDAGPARDLLGRFLITGDDCMRPIRTLSGGEKNKLALAALTNAQPNLLVLDEPTNHLDMDSRTALAQILRDYNGTLVLISHDRWLLSEVTEQILDIRSGGPVFSLRGFREYGRDGAAVTTSASPKSPVSSVESSLSQREITKEIVRVEALIGRLEDQIADSESALAGVEANLAAPAGLDVTELVERHGRVKVELDDLMKQWEAQNVRLEELRSMQGPRQPA